MGESAERKLKREQARMQKKPVQSIAPKGYVWATEAPPPSHAEMSRLQEIVKIAGFESRYYDAWEIARLMEGVKFRTVDLFGQLLLAYTFPIIENMMAVQERVSEILGYVRRTPGKLWTEDEDTKVRCFPFSEVDVGDIAKYYAQTIVLMQGAGIGAYFDDDDPDRVKIAPRVCNAITALINDSNDKPLRELAIEYVNLPDGVKTYLTNFKLPGAPTEPVIDRLCKLAKPYIDQRYTYGAALTAITTDLGNIEILNPLQKEELLWLENWSERAFTNAYKKRYRK